MQIADKVYETVYLDASKVHIKQKWFKHFKHNLYLFLQRFSI